MPPFGVRALKLADRIAGPPLLALLARLRHLEGYGERLAAGAPAWENRPLDPAGIRRILVIRPGGIGDAVLCYPMLAELRRRFPGADLDILAERRNAGLFAVNDLVRRVLRYDRFRGGGLPAALAGRYDLLVDTEQYHRLTALVTFLAGAPQRCGFDTLGRGRFLTHRVRYRETEYEVYSFLRLAEAVSGEATAFDPARPFLEVAPRWREWAERAVLGPLRGSPLVVIVPETGTPTRIWPADRYREVARWLLGQGCAVCILGGHEGVRAAARIAAGLDPARALNLAGRTSLPESCAILEGAALYLGADCGVLHVAVGVGTPTVHMFGSGIQEKWAPVGPGYHLIDKRLPCSPCTRYGSTPPCPYGAACMRAITVGEVIAAVGEALAAGGRSHG